MSAQKGNILVPILVIVALLALATASYFFWQNQQLKGELLGPYTPTNAPSSTPTTQDETTNWKNYSGSTFTFKYPQGWHTGIAGDGTIWFDPQDLNFESITHPGQVKITLSIRKENANNATSYKTLQSSTKLFSGIKFGFIVTPEEDVGIQGQKMYAYTIQDGTIYILGLTNPVDKNIFNQILSTFKFTN